MKRVFIVHRWDGSPDEPLYQWFSTNLKNEGFEVKLLEMPSPSIPEIENWVGYLASQVGELDNNTYFIGHSIGCQTILRYLETQKRVAGGAILLAPWFHLQGMEDEEVEEIARPWVETPIDFDKVKSNLHKLTSIFSDNDPYVPLSDKDIFKQVLNSKIIVEHDKGHFTADDGIEEMPLVLKEFLEITK